MTFARFSEPPNFRLFQQYRPKSDLSTCPLSRRYRRQSRHQTRPIRAPRLFDFDIATQCRSRNRERMTFGDANLPFVVWLSPCQTGPVRSDSENTGAQNVP